MSRYTGPRNKLRKRLGFIYGFNRVSDLEIEEKEQEEEDINLNSLYLKRHLNALLQHQRIRFFYGISHSQLISYEQKFKQSKFFKALESRLDSILFRLGFFKSVPFARQAITHRHIKVNNKIVTSPNFLCKPTDHISLYKMTTLQIVSNKNIKEMANEHIWFLFQSKKINLLKSNLLN